MAASGRTWIGGFKRTFLGLIGVLLLFSALASASSDPIQSPSADLELICHTEDPAECYPKVFVPTDEFKVVHEDQDLPPGLHVQLDIQTGQKQAKLYDPTETNPELEGLPVDRSMLVVDPEAAESDDEIPIPAGAPIWEAFGKIKEPREKLEGFGKMTAAVKEWRPSALPNDSDGSSELLGSLERLEDVAHDMYHGLQLAEDTDAVRALLCMALQNETPELAKPLTERRDFLAASALAGAVRNNPPALKAIEAAWESHIAKTMCPIWVTGEGSPNMEEVPLAQALYAGIAPQNHWMSSGPASGVINWESLKHVPEYTRYPLMVLEGLLRSPVIREEFLTSGGTGKMLEVLQFDRDDWKPLRERVARILNDVFLDEENGAVLGLWPSQAAPQDKKHEADLCSAGETKEQCWEYNLAQIGRERPGDKDWSEPLLKLVQKRRPDANSGGRVRDEL